MSILVHVTRLPRTGCWALPRLLRSGREETGQHLSVMLRGGGGAGGLGPRSLGPQALAHAATAAGPSAVSLGKLQQEKERTPGLCQTLSGI